MFRIITGTYERLLYGIDVKWSEESVNNQKPNVSYDKSVNLELVIAYATHIGCIKAAAVGGSFLASGSTDEVIKYVIAIS